jgi:hypothetical protein
MKPTTFQQSNHTLNAPENTSYSRNVESVDALPIWTDGEQCVSCWKMTWRERLSALFFGKIWLAVLFGSTQPPVYLQASDKYFKRSEL